MKIRVKVGPYDPERLIEDHAGSIEPQGREIWCGGEDDLSGAVLNSLDAELRLGTWYPFADFQKRVNDFATPDGHEVPSTLAISQQGVEAVWSAAIQISESQAAMMVCSSIVKLISEMTPPNDVWVWVE